MTPLERAARAVESAIFNPALRASVVIECDDPSRVHLAIARAVLQAIREPSEGMIDEGSGFAGQRCESGAQCDENALLSWQAMIDAALEEK